MTVLRAGYLSLVNDLGLLGIPMLGKWVPEMLALYVLTIGALGTMTFAVIGRAVFCHTGRDLHAGPWVVVIYVLATVPVLTRAAFEVVPAIGLLWATAGAWSLAFALFTAVYAPMVFGQRNS